MTLVQVSDECNRLVFPDVMAIYEPDDADRVRQVGTGILFQHRARHILVTAKHCLFGHKGNENAGDKAVFIDGAGLRQIGDLRANGVYHCEAFDLAALELDGLTSERGFSTSVLPPATDQPRFVTICGYLARDFRRSLAGKLLAPQPFVYSNTAAPLAVGFIGLKYEKRRNRSSRSGKLVMSPIPAGLSGGPMLDSEALRTGVVRIVGVFTDKPPEKGIAYGEASPKVLAMLDTMPS